MGFDWDSHNARTAEYENRPIAKADKKEELLKAETVFEIVGVRPVDTKYGPSWFVDINTDQDMLTITFKRMNGGGRDQLLAGMADHLSGSTEPIKAKLVQWGEAKDGRSPMWGLERA